MTYDDYFHKANQYFLKHKEHLRYGQALMNYLWEYSSKLYTDVVFARLDPFYDDEIVPEFLNFLSNRIDQINEASNQ